MPRGLLDPWGLLWPLFPLLHHARETLPGLLMFWPESQDPCMDVQPPGDRSCSPRSPARPESCQLTVKCDEQVQLVPAWGGLDVPFTQASFCFQLPAWKARCQGWQPGRNRRVPAWATSCLGPQDAGSSPPPPRPQLP